MAKSFTGEDTSQVGWTPWLLIACFTVAGSSSFGFGYGIGGPNQLAVYITETFRDANSTKSSETPSIIDDIKMGLPQTFFTIANAVGALTGPKFYSLSRFESRRSIFYANFPFYFLSVLCVIISYYRKWYFLYLISRIFHGYQGGMACAIVPPYINEIASRKVRGAAGTIHQLFITIGIAASQIIGLPPVLGSVNTWQWAFAVGAIPSAIALFLVRFLPESPSDVLLKHGDAQLATRSLQRLRNTSNVTEEFEEMKRQQDAFRGAGETRSMSMIQLLKSKRLRWPFIITMTLFGGQALSGINAVFFYSSDIFQTASVAAAYMPYAVVMTGLINVGATIVAIRLMEQWGRRALIIFPGMLMSIICLLLAVFIKINETLSNKYLAFVSVGLTLLYIICFAVGWGPVPFVYCTEVFRQDARDAALVSGLLLNYAFNCALSLTFPFVNRRIGGFVFGIFMVIMASQIVLFWKRMPETKNKTIAQIEQFWKLPPLATTEDIDMRATNTDVIDSM